MTRPARSVRPSGSSKRRVDSDGSVPEQWSATPARVGEKVRSYGTFLITDGAQVLGIANSKFDLKAIAPAAEESTSSVAPSAAASPTEEAEQAPAVEQNTPVFEAPAEAEAPVQAPASAHQEAEPVIGYTEAPGQVEPQVMEKQIASCGTRASTRLVPPSLPMAPPAGRRTARLR